MTLPLKDMLTDEDLAILTLESPTVAGHTCKVLTIESPLGSAPLDIERLRASVGSRLELEPRMLEKLSDASGRGRQLRWVAADDFEIAEHVLEYGLDRPADRQRMLEIVAELMSGRLDRSRPLWQFHLVELERSRHALVCLIHHCMADGMTAMRIASRVIWDAAGPTPVPKKHSQSAAKSAATEKHLPVRRCIARELLPRAHDTPLDRHPSNERTVAVAGASLADIKQAGKRHGGTINDIVLCAVAGGLRSWLEYHGGSLQGVTVKVPVSLHDHDEGSNALGNHDSFMVVNVGTDEPDPLVRLDAIVAQTRDRKAMHDAQTLDRVFNEIRHVSGLASHAITKWSGSPRVFTVNVSNVPGPRSPITVLDGPVTEMFTLAEIGDRHALRVAVVSMGDQITFGLCADAVAVADADRIAAAIEADLGALLRS